MCTKCQERNEKGIHPEGMPIVCIRVEKPLRGDICTECRRRGEKCSFQAAWKRKNKGKKASAKDLADFKDEIQEELGGIREEI